MTLILYFLAFIAFFLVALNLLPIAGALPSGIASGFTLIIGYMKSWNFFFPITELFTLAALVLTFEAGILLFKIVKWLISIVRGNTSA